jgi:hypothetical protein
MPRKLRQPEAPQSESPFDRAIARRQAQEHMQAPLKIKTRDVPPELAAKWYGMPPTEAKTYASSRSDTITF